MKRKTFSSDQIGLLIQCILIPLATGLVSALFTRGGMATFKELNQPPLSPPGWLFPIVWTILYILMGIASYLVYTARSSRQDISRGLLLYGIQLFFNFFWSIWFFNLHAYLFSFIWLVVLWLLILAALLQFSRVSVPAALLMLPYLLWVTFAGYLNLAISILN